MPIIDIAEFRGRMGLDQSTGDYALAYNAAGGTPWHNEGQTLTAEALVNVELAAQEARLTYEVERVRLGTIVEHEDGSETLGAPVASHFANRRTDTGAVLGVVGRYYHITQNLEAFGRLQPLLDAGNARIETAGALRGGRDAWMLLQFDLDSPLVTAAFNHGDTVVPYALVTNNFSGARTLLVMETPTRLVCKNTFRAATSRVVRRALGETLKRAVKVRHTKSAVENLDAAIATLWGDLVKRYDALAVQVALLRASRLSEEEMGRVVLDVAAPLPTENPKSKRAETSRDRVVAKRGEIRRLWEDGIRHSGDRSAWEALNAVTQSIDHDDGETWRTRGGSAQRLASLYDGNLGWRKQLVVDSLLEHILATDEGRTLLDRITDTTTSASALDRILAQQA